MEFERTLDDAEVFAYRNWILGELVQGPDIERYWYNTTWMYPRDKMPDPMGGLRLTKLGAKVSFRKSIFKKPVKVRGPEDWIDSSTKRTKIVDHPIWLVTINLPIRYINRGLDMVDELISADIEKTNQDLAQSYGVPGQDEMDNGDGIDNMDELDSIGDM
jgi:hypothetical protein